MKILILGFSLIWYFTCRHWWKSAILVIIAVELAKIITALLNTSHAIDEIDYITSLPITIPIILALALISKKLNKYNLSIELRSKIDNEIDKIYFELYNKKSADLDLLKKQFEDKKKSRSKIESIIYLKELITIRDEFYRI